MPETTFYSVGHNHAGYLPDSVPTIAYSAAEAKQSLIDDMRFVADGIDPGLTEDEDERYAEDLTALAEDLNLADVSGGWDGSVDYRSTTEIWWITPVDPADVDLGDGPGNFDW